MKFLNLNLAKVLGASVIICFLGGLLFRFAIYNHTYITPNAPYGISDIIEYLLGWLLILIWAITVLAAIALAFKGPRHNRIASAWLFGICAAIATLIVPLHNLAAKWAI